MSYKALYRTYRPQKFADVTGQEVVVQTLQNAIKNNKISHAYLFSGPRGTGKTSIARIFAKALNCSNLIDNEPCDNCVSCQEISGGYNPDVIEIDAASNNGVDEIRDIRDKVKFLPSGAKYKVYIIDEVHMLSGGAFNALLKTLEEPPKHAIFILATTEPQKLPATIISRCQRFEFKALSINEINERLKEICALEGVSITEEALNSISEAAEGAMRDALSILDQAISYGNVNIEVDDINGVTGSLSFDKIIALTKAIEERSVYNAIGNLNELINSGKEVSKIINSLLVFYRDVLLYKSIGDTEYSKYIFAKDEFREFSDNIQTSKIMYFIDVLCDVQNKVKFSTTPNIFLEISLIKMCNITIEELDVMKRLSDLEEKYNNLGEFDLPSEGVGVVDNEKLNTLELRVNQIINELNRLEIRKQIEKIDQLKSVVDNMSVNQSRENNKELMQVVNVLKDKVDELELFINKDNTSYSNDILEKINILENQINNLDTNNIDTESTKDTIDLSDIYEKIESIENQISNIELEGFEELKSVVDGLVEDVNNIKENIVEKANNEFDYSENENDITEIKEKVMFLEKRLYQIIAGELSTKKVVKKDKKNNGQIMLFGEELLSVNDFTQNKEDFDFEELQKPAPQQEKQDLISEVLVEKEVATVDVVKEEETKEDVLSEETEDNNEVENNIVEPVIEEVKEDKAQEESNNEMISEEIVQKPNNIGLFESDVITPAEKEPIKETPSKYFVLDKEEVIQKEKSVLVVGEKRSIDERESISKDIIAQENKKEENTLENKVLNNETTNDVVENNDKFASYNIKDIEQILHDSRAIEAKNDKARIEQVWKNMTRGARPEFLSVIETLQEGKVVVVGNKEFIIVFPNVSLCNIVMRRKFKDVAIRLLYNLLGDTYDYAALPIDVWTSKSREYKEQYQIGIRYPVLKPLNVPGLEISSGAVEYKSKNDQTIEKTIELFGKENIVIK